MKKFDIEGIIITYKDAMDLNNKVKDVLLAVQRKREKLQADFNAVRKKERGLKKFLGIKDTIKELAASQG